MPSIKHRPRALLVAAVLIVVGAVLMVLRTSWPGQGGVPEGDSVWQLTFEFQFHVAAKGAVAKVSLPADTPRARVFGQNFFYPGLKQERPKGAKGEVRQAHFVVSRPGNVTIKAEFQIHCGPKPPFRGDPKAAALSSTRRDQYLSGDRQIPTEASQVIGVYRQLVSSEPEKKKLLEKIAEYCEKKILPGPANAPNDVVDVLSRHQATALGRARAMTALCRVGKIPARLVVGIILREKPDIQPHYWVEVLSDKKWLAFDPENGHRYELPIHFIPVRRESSEIIEVNGGENLVQKFAAFRIAVPSGLLAGIEKRPIEIIDLTRLPLATQGALMSLLLLPVGALLTTFARRIIGIRTYGTFTPTLLALAIVYVDWLTATIIFMIVIVIGIGGRSLLPGFKLMKIPRLSMVFTLVSITMAITVSALDYISFAPAGHVVLLPMVVLTSIVDRFYSVADEDNTRNAVLRLWWTIFVASGCVLIFKWQSLGRMLLVYPELHFITLGFILLLGLYDKARLTDLKYFKPLTEKQAAKQTPKTEQ